MSTIAAMLAVRAQDDSTGVMDAGGSWTWRQAVAEGAARGALARSLFGGGPPHIGVLLPNGPEYLFWLNGAALAGAAIVGINPTRRGEALAADVRATDCALIVTDDDGAALLEGLDLDLDTDKVLIVDSDRYGTLVEEYRGSRGRRRGAGRDRPGGGGLLVPPHLHFGHHRRTEGGALHPGPAGRDRRDRRPRLRLQHRRRLLLPHAVVPRQRAHGACGDHR